MMMAAGGMGPPAAQRKAMQDKKPQATPTRADRFWSIFLFTKNGRIKSPLIIYSFSLSLVLLLVYGAAYWFLIDPVHHLFRESSTMATDFFETLFPAMAGCVLVCLVHKWSGAKRFIPAAHLWLFLYAVLTLLYMLNSLESPDDKTLFVNLFIRLVPVPVLLGGLSSFLIYKKHHSPMRTGKTPVSVRSSQDASS